jgi:hypothetical protein
VVCFLDKTQPLKENISWDRTLGKYKSGWSSGYRTTMREHAVRWDRRFRLSIASSRRADAWQVLVGQVPDLPDPLSAGPAGRRAGLEQPEACDKTAT